jgi:hypothetical protein
LEIFNTIDDDHTEKTKRCEIPKLNNSKRKSKPFYSFNRLTTCTMKYVIRTIGLIKYVTLVVGLQKTIVARSAGHLRFGSGFS